MANNFLEQLIAEWYEYNGYFVRKNVFVGKRAKGGYECELDIIAYHPEHNHILHIEPSTDANSWAKREKRYKKKFQAGKKYIPSLFPTLFKKGSKPPSIEHSAVFVVASKCTYKKIAGGQIVLISELLEDIFSKLKNTSILKKAVPEQYPILRSFQFVIHYKKSLAKILYDSSL